LELIYVADIGFTIWLLLRRTLVPQQVYSAKFAKQRLRHFIHLSYLARQANLDPKIVELSGHINTNLFHKALCPLWSFVYFVTLPSQ